MNESPMIDDIVEINRNKFEINWNKPTLYHSIIILNIYLNHIRCTKSIYITDGLVFQHISIANCNCRLSTRVLICSPRLNTHWNGCPTRTMMNKTFCLSSLLYVALYSIRTQLPYKVVKTQVTSAYFQTLDKPS